jgi:hypothetical protein
MGTCTGSRTFAGALLAGVLLSTGKRDLSELMFIICMTLQDDLCLGSCDRTLSSYPLRARTQVLIFVVFAANDRRRSALAVHLPVSMLLKLYGASCTLS